MGGHSWPSKKANKNSLKLFRHVFHFADEEQNILYARIWALERWGQTERGAASEDRSGFLWWWWLGNGSHFFGVFLREGRRILGLVEAVEGHQAGGREGKGQGSRKATLSPCGCSFPRRPKAKFTLFTQLLPPGDSFQKICENMPFCAQGSPE